ncbi:spore coat protein GerQ [Saccharibacillus sp. JS10]|uniref:spore coat protein GerQ n=1 Tax=Saccharibacillus sp. JS10 TaxID=2950552 RepID=UPI00210A2FF5|nr:spore coat protein GerQ [Saccharibacillus sp. JS10]MCQ4085506.1 spore coat protein GerQ [Saccharibacillus sp. JS10]
MEYSYSPVTYRISSGAKQRSGYTRSGSSMADASIPQTQYEQPTVRSTLQNNLGRTGTFYMVAGMNTGITATSLAGRLEAAGSDHVVLSVDYGQRTVIPLNCIDYVVFDDTTGYFYSGNEAFFAGQ